MTLKEKSKQDNAIMHVLKVTEWSYLLGHTNNGALTMKLAKGGTEKDYVFHLDSVPYPQEINEKLLELFDGVLWEKEQGVQFYSPVFGNTPLKEEDVASLASLIDNGTTAIDIETPEGWKCERENCGVE